VEPPSATEWVLATSATPRPTDRATRHCLVPYPPDRALGFLSKILQENGVRIDAAPRGADRIVGRVGRRWSASGCRVRVEVYPHPGASFVEITAESRAKGGGISSALVERLAHAAGGAAGPGRDAASTTVGSPPNARDSAGGAGPLKMNAKLCLVGESAVGKTSLVRRFVLDVYGDAYVRTIGTKVTRKEIVVFPPDGLAVNVNLVIWDIMADEGFRDILQDAYFTGARGVLAVADVTRGTTLPALASWIDVARGLAGHVPVLIAGNKSDAAGGAELGPGDLEDFAASVGGSWVPTSAKTGDNVEGAFRRLAVSIASDPTRGPGRPAPDPGESHR
jgi:GTPase SAR1 family protein